MESYIVISVITVQEHKMNHTGIFNFTCATSGFEATTEAFLENHKEKKHMTTEDQRNTECQGCQNRFYSHFY